MMRSFGDPKSRPKLTILGNNACVHEPCNLCGEDHKPPCGLIVALAAPGYEKFVCDVCAIKHDPRLWALAELGLESESWVVNAPERYRERLRLISTHHHEDDPDFPRLLFNVRPEAVEAAAKTPNLRRRQES
jgi:hypothetical protein